MVAKDFTTSSQAARIGKKEPGKFYTMVRLNLFSTFLIATAVASASGAGAAKLTVRQVSGILVKAAPGRPPDFSHDDLSFLDLSDLDFKQAKFVGADLYGANLSDDNLSGADLSEANLDHAVITRTNFVGANLTNASLYDTAAYSTLEPSSSEAPNFAGANLSGARVMARLTGVDMHGANLARVQMGVRRDQLKTLLWTDLSGCNLANANLTDADLHGVPWLLLNWPTPISRAPIWP